MILICCCAPKYLSKVVFLYPQIEPSKLFFQTADSENCHPHDSILPYTVHRGPLELSFLKKNFTQDTMQCTTKRKVADAKREIGLVHLLRRRPNPERKTTWLSKTKLYKEENHFEIQRKTNFCKVEKIRCDTFSQSYVNGLKRAGEQMVEVTNPGIQTFPFFSLNFLFFMHFKLLRLLRICQVIDDPPRTKS